VRYLGARPAPVKLPFRVLGAVGYDLAAAAASWWLAYTLRFNFSIPDGEWATLLVGMVVATAAYGAMFGLFRLYSTIWRYASLHDLRRIILAIGVGALVVPALFVMLRVGQEAPRAVLVIQPLLLVMLIGGSRIALRIWQDRSISPFTHPESTPLIVLGAGTAAASLIRELARQRTWRVAALLDDDPQKQGREISGHKVVGPLQHVGPVAEALAVKHAVIAMPGSSHQQRLRALELCKAANLEVRTVPSYFDLVSGRVSVSAIRKVELDDLLGRDPVRLDTEGLHRLIQGSTVLVTGAGGSIGAELCRQIARFSPARLVLFELSEFALYTIEQEFADHFPDISLASIIGDVKSEARVRQVIARYRPRVIFHAAAYKHVPLLENENACEALWNNVLGTLTVARTARSHGVTKFVMISTDKAVNPRNVMGATKRLAELVCQGLAVSSETQFIVVRFGNVLGSTGSVIPRFREQIARGGPVTVTHPDIERYFMSIPEAAQLVLQAALMGRNGEIFILDMGEPVRILTLAKQLIRLSGFSEDEIKVVFTGLRAGEKLYEELLAGNEQAVATPHPKLRVARPANPPSAEFVNEISAWLLHRSFTDAEVMERLSKWVPEYRMPALAEGVPPRRSASSSA
jgi:FlaA1/EpsC-like NDP-sugar epimerase